MSKEFSDIFSDDEFERLLQERHKAERALSTDQAGWDRSGRVPPHRPGDGLPESTIEQHFPQIAKQLILVWPSEACAVYLNNLIVTRRPRQGFPPEVLDDLLMLHSMNDMLLRSMQSRSAFNSSTGKLPPTS
jgi:hypothetical protein